MLIAEFLEELQRRADADFKGRLDQSFVSWYIEAQIGDHVDWHFTDGPNDCGIDAVVWRPNDEPPVMILQSKFAEKIGKNLLSANAYSDFESVVRAFRFGGQEFEELIDRAGDLQKYYRKAYEALASGNWHTGKKAFRMVTTLKRRSESEFGLIPEDHFVYFDKVLHLYKDYRKLQTPPARDLSLSIQDKLTYRDSDRGMVSYLFNAHVSDFRKYLEQTDVARLVARNIRFEVPTSQGKKVRGAIQRTYEDKPKDFWYFHNGVTILCEDFVEKNQTATLYRPSVVNGAQTLFAIQRSAVKQSPALVAVRAIVRSGDSDENLDDDQWVQKLIRAVNTQNKVEPYDFRSNDPEQVELQRRFNGQRVFYERKRGEWKQVRTDPKFKGHARISLPKLAQILTAAWLDEQGQGVLLIKRGTGPIFEDKVYKKLFPSRKKVASRFKRIYFAYRLYRLLSKSRLGSTTRKEFRKRKHSSWHVLWIMHRLLFPTLLKSKFSLEQVRDHFDEFEGQSFRGIRARKVVKVVAKAVWQAYRIGRKKDPEHWTPNNFFKQKYGIKVLDTIAVPRARLAIRVMAKLLDGTIN
jgi:hypothetical protein